MSKNVKTAEPTGPKFVVGPHVAQGRFMNDHISKICLEQNLIFIEFLKILKLKFFWESANFFLLFHNVNKEEHLK